MNIKLTIILLLVSTLLYSSSEFINNVNICTKLQEKKSKSLQKECKEFLTESESLSKMNTKLKNILNKDEKKQFFQRYAKAFRKLVSLDERMDKHLRFYILNNYTSDNQDTLNTVDIIFSSKYYIVSKSTIQTLIDNSGGNVNFSPEGLEKIKLHIDKIAAEERKEKESLVLKQNIEKEKIRQQKSQREKEKLKEKNIQQLNNYHMKKAEEKQDRINAMVNKALYNQWMQDTNEFLYLCNKTYRDRLQKSIACESLGMMYMSNSNVPPLYTKAKAAFHLACDGGNYQPACNRYNELQDQGY